MEKFKEKLKKRLRFNIALSIALGISYIFFCLFAKIWLSPSQQEMIPFAGGFSCGFGSVFILKTLNYKKALKNEKTLKEVFIKETDERVLSIHFKAGLLSFKVSILALSIVAIIFGFINITVFYTLFGAVILIIISKTITEIIYSKKYM